MARQRKADRQESGSIAGNGNGKGGYTTKNTTEGDGDGDGDGKDYDDPSPTEGTGYGNWVPPKDYIRNQQVNLTGSNPYSSGSTATHALATNTRSSVFEEQKSELQDLIGVVKGLASSFTTVMKQMQPAPTTVQEMPNDQCPLPKKPPVSQTSKVTLGQNGFRQMHHGQGLQMYQHSDFTPGPLGYSLDDNNRISPHYQHANFSPHVNFSEKISHTKPKSNYQHYDVSPDPRGYPLEDNNNRYFQLYQQTKYNQHTNFYPQANYHQLQALGPDHPGGMTQAEVLRIFSDYDRDNFEREERRYQFQRNQREKADLVNILRYFPR